MPKHEIKRRKLYELHLTKLELLHLRDLFTVSFPSGDATISQGLAVVESRSHVESAVWKKVAGLCKDAGLPVGEEAPDYVVAPTAPPPMSVFQVASEPQDEESESAIFDDDEG